MARYSLVSSLLQFRYLLLKHSNEFRQVLLRRDAEHAYVCGVVPVDDPVWHADHALLRQMAQASLGRGRHFGGRFPNDLDQMEQGKLEQPFTVDILA